MQYFILTVKSVCVCVCFLLLLLLLFIFFYTGNCLCKCKCGCISLNSNLIKEKQSLRDGIFFHLFVCFGWFFSSSVYTHQVCVIFYTVNIKSMRISALETSIRMNQICKKVNCCITLVLYDLCLTRDVYILHLTRAFFSSNKK